MSEHSGTRMARRVHSRIRRIVAKLRLIASDLRPQARAGEGDWNPHCQLGKS